MRSIFMGQQIERQGICTADLPLVHTHISKADDGIRTRDLRFGVDNP